MRSCGQGKAMIGWWGRDKGKKRDWGPAGGRQASTASSASLSHLPSGWSWLLASGSQSSTCRLYHGKRGKQAPADFQQHAPESDWLNLPKRGWHSVGQPLSLPSPNPSSSLPSPPVFAITFLHPSHHGSRLPTHNSIMTSLCSPLPCCHPFSFFLSFRLRERGKSGQVRARLACLSLSVHGTQSWIRWTECGLSRCSWSIVLISHSQHS